MSGHAGEAVYCTRLSEISSPRLEWDLLAAHMTGVQIVRFAVAENRPAWECVAGK